MQDYSNLKKALSGILEDTKKKKADEEAIRLKRNEEDRAGILGTLGKDLGGVLQPYIEQLQSSSKMSAEEMSRIIAQSVKIDAPSVDTAPIQEAIYKAISSVKVNSPVVNYTPPSINVPKIEMPTEMGIKGWISMMGYDKGFLSDPFPVQLRDSKGNPIDLSALKTSLVSGGSSGKADFFTIKGFGQSAYGDLVNTDGRLRVSVETGGSGLTDAELRASSVPVEQVSGSVWSVAVVSGGTATSAVNVVDSSGIVYSGSNPLPITGSVAVSGVTGSIGATILNGEGLARDSWLVSGITNTVAANIVDSSGIAFGGSNPLRVTISAANNGIAKQEDSGHTSGDTGVFILGVRNDASAVLTDGDLEYTGISTDSSGRIKVSSINSSTQATIIDSSGVGYSGSNPVPVMLVAGSVSSTVVVGPTASDSADNDSAPVKIGGIARTANPSAVGAGDAVSFTADDLGRQVIRPVQVRDLIATAYVALSTGSAFGTETTLLASGAGTFLDLIYVMGTNDSDVATYVDLRASTGGTVCKRIEIPAGGTAGVALPVPYPAPFTDHTWTVDAPDITGTNLTISALFSKEV